MARFPTFKIIDWDDLPPGHQVVEEFDLRCHCGREAICPVAEGGVIEARAGMTFIFDPKNRPPSFFMPCRIRCRKCGREYGRP